ncbi:MAG: hypothetical protein AAF805_01125 [Planctomycetota bacterium]
MAEATLAVTLAAGGVSIQGSARRSGDGGIGYDPPVPAAAAGTLATRTDAETGSLTMGASAHGVTTGAVVDLFWEGGARYGVTVGAVAGVTVPIGADNSGTGDDLPAASTALTVSVPESFNASIDGDRLAVLAVQLDAQNTERGRLTLRDSGDAAIATLDLVGGAARGFDIAGGDANPFTGNPIASAEISRSGATGAATMKICGLQDVTV